MVWHPVHAADALGLRPCSLEPSAAAIASNCPQDGQRYQVSPCCHAWPLPYESSVVHKFLH